MNNTVKYALILVILSYVFLMFGNGIFSLTNPDEVFYAQTAREMVQQNTWMTPYLFGHPQFEKPIFLYWCLRLGFIIFGVTDFSSRFFPALFAILGVLALYLFGLAAFKNVKKAFIAALVLASGGLYIGLARTVFTDMIFSVWILFSLTAFYWGYCYTKRKGIGIILSFIFSGLAVLTKGPLGFILPALVITIFLVLRKDSKFILTKYSFWGLILFLLVSFPWYILMIKKYGASFTHEFLYNDHIRRLLEAEHIENDNWYFYPAAMIACIFPWSLYTLAGLISLFRRLKKEANPAYLFLCSWIVIIFLVFQTAHSKLISYIFPLFPALAVVGGDFIYDSIFVKKEKRAFFICSLIIAALLFIFPIGMLVNAPRFSSYISSMLPVYILSGILLLVALFTTYFLFAKKFFRMIILLSFLLIIILSGAAFMHRNFEPYLSSKAACRYLLANYDAGDTLICSKFYARGTRYYTDKNIVVVDLPGKNYFSPHPVPFLSSDTKVKEFLLKHPAPAVYCLLKEANREDFERIAEDKRFKFTVLKKIGNEYISKIEVAGAPHN